MTQVELIAPDVIRVWNAPFVYVDRDARKVIFNIKKGTGNDPFGYIG